MSVWGTRVLGVTLVLLLVGGCGRMRDLEEPMPATYYAPLGPERARGVVVMLPGYRDTPESFDAYGFTEVLRERAPGYDVVLPDAHYGYYRGGRLRAILHRDVIAPLVEAGYREIWLVGVSMGGLGSLGYTERHPEGVTGLILLAPYLGSDEVIHEIVSAGGLEAWLPGAPAAGEDPRARSFREVWAWLRARLVEGTPGAEIYLGFGMSDRLRSPLELLVPYLPAERVLVRPGGHGWDVWSGAFDVLVERALGPSNPRGRADARDLP